MLAIVANMGQNMSRPRNFRKHIKEVPQVQTTVLRMLEQMKRPETKTVDEQYTEGKRTRTEVSKLPRSKLIITQQHSVF
jgi:hypothetical protein